MIEQARRTRPRSRARRAAWRLAPGAAAPRCSGDPEPPRPQSPAPPRQRSPAPGRSGARAPTRAPLLRRPRAPLRRHPRSMAGATPMLRPGMARRGEKAAPPSYIPPPDDLREMRYIGNAIEPWKWRRAVVLPLSWRSF